MEGLATAKRRKVGKTPSCCECKYRKKRCDFESGSNSTCVSCQRRGIPCISQGSADNADDEHNEYDGVAKHIDRVEDLVRQLVHKRGAQSRDQTSRQVARRSVPLDVSNYSTLRSVSHERMSRGPSLTEFLNSTLPAPQIATLILNVNKQYNAPLQILQTLQVDGSLVEVPSVLSPDVFPTVHPVDFARRLIKLALALRELDASKSDHISLDLGEPTVNTAQRYFQTASCHVMSQDYLVGSFDGLETLLLQSRYHISMGELQTAWYIYRRAFHIARLIDLPTQAKVPDSRADSIWFQLVYGEIFLSLILGQPTAITGDIVLVENTNAHTPAQSLERVHVMIARRLASRNVRIENRHRDESRGAAQDSYRETRSLDLRLKKAARNMPTAWWKAPTFAAEELDREVMDKTAKLLVQTHQYYLLVVLHQPHILGAPPPNELKYGRDHMDYTYSATATVAASREILTRYLVLRNFHQSSSYRGFDEKAFAAAMSLLLVHLNGHSLGATNVLEHQRPHDLGILEDVIHCMETVCSVNRDLRGYSRARTLRELSRIEANAADGCGYVVYSTYAFNEMKGAESVDIRTDLEIALPYLGNIYVTRQTTDSFGEDLSATTQMASLAPQFLLKPPNQQDQYTPQNTLGVFGGEIFYDESDSSWFDKWSIHEERFS